MDPLLHIGYALFRIVVCFAVIAAGSRRKWPLELSLLAAGFVLALLSGLSPLQWGSVVLLSFGDEGMPALLCAILSILLLSGVMEKSGQSRRLVVGVEAAVKSARVRLIFFPAMIGLLPMPGGAVFSCPMVQETARRLDLSGEDKSLLNYWFRHIWELVWPLYPGFVLYCGLCEFSPWTAAAHNWPSLLASVVSGRLLFLRRAPAVVQTAEETPEREEGARDRVSLWRESLPFIVGLSGAFAVRMLVPDLASGFAFGLGFSAGTAVCLISNRQSPAVILSVLGSRKSLGISALVVTVFIFKNVLGQSGIMDSLGGSARNPVILFLACTLLPLLSGMLTGVLVALVGISFPLLLTMLQQADLWAERLPWLTLALMFGNIGQMLSPVHVCLVVTCRFFNVGLGGTLRRLVLPCLILAATALIWFGVLLALQG